MKKILLFIGMFLITLNVKALTFNVDITNIEDKGNNGTIGSITNIDIPNKTLDALFQNIGDEVSFDLTITNSGNRAGTLRSIGVTSTNDKIEYTNNLPENGLSINGNDFNTVTITARVKDGATNGTSTSTIKITYNYDEGSCPEGEILSEDESMCLCPTGKVRNEQGVCIDPPKDVTCEEDEIYNETKKICEKKEVPDGPTSDDPEPEKEVIPTPTINPSNPKTMDNIILITLLFFVSGLGIYAVLFKKLNTTKKKVVVGVITGITTLALSFTVLASVFGLDNLLSAIVNPITKKQELVVTVNETIEMLETWDGNCRTTSYTPEDVFEGGSGTSEDPYQIKTANQLACFAESVNDGNSYEGKFIKQTKDIKLNNNLVSGLASGGYGYNNWTSAGDYRWGTYFAGTYDGDNHTISGLLLTNDSANTYSPKGLFGAAKGATFKNLTISDAFIEVNGQKAGALVGKTFESLTIDNVSASGIYSEYASSNSGIVGEFVGYEYDVIPVTENEFVKIENTTNNIYPVSAGIIGNISLATTSITQEEPNIIFRNVTNNGTFCNNYNELHCGGIVNSVSSYRYVNENMSGVSGKILMDNAVNNANTDSRSSTNNMGGLVGTINIHKIEIINSHNIGEISCESNSRPNIGGLAGQLVVVNGGVTVDNCYNSGNINHNYSNSFETGLTESETNDLSSILFANDIGGLIGVISTNASSTNLVKDSYNSGEIKGVSYFIGGILADIKQSEYQDAGGDNLTIQNSYNTGDIYTVYGNVGGIASLFRGTITGCHNSGNIYQRGITRFDEYASSSYRHPIYAGPIAGLVSEGNLSYDYEADAIIIDSYNEGNIVSNAKSNRIFAAGICGACGSITNSHNSGNITSEYASEFFDGITLSNDSFGNSIPSANIVNSYNEGTITPGTGYSQ